MFALAAASQVAATDWPRFRGPDLGATSPDPILKRWPTNGLGVAWRVPLSGGYASRDYSSFAVWDGKVFTLKSGTNTVPPFREFCVALDATSGTQVWATVLSATNVFCAYSTPTVKDGRVYAYGSGLKLLCLDAATGTNVWQRDLAKEFGGTAVGNDNSQSPWVEDGRVFVQVSAATNCLLAFDAANGTLLWQGHTNRLTYGSPVGATIHGVRQIIFPEQFGLVSVTPDTGQFLWRHNWGMSSTRGPSPVVHDDIAICVPEYGGGKAFRVAYSNGVFSTVSLWTNTSLWGQLVTLVIHEGHLYGAFGGYLQCLELETGQLKWRTNAVVNGSVVLVDNHLLVLTENGGLVLAKASPLGYEPLTSCPARIGQYVNSPAVSSGRIYFRDPGEMVCLDAAIPAPLQIRATPLPGGDRLWFTVASSDGRPIYTNRAPQIGIRWSTDLGQPLVQWQPFPTRLTYTNGALCCETPILSNGTNRYYVAVEQGR